MAKRSLLSRVLTSVIFRQSTRKAGRYARNGASLLSLIGSALNKSKSVGGDEGIGFREQIGLLSRLIKAYVAGDYRQIQTKTLISIVASLIYFVSPIDVVPDFLPLLGFADDIALIIWMFNSLEGELVNFRQWERDQARVAGKVIDIK